jgi:transposase InsO family protein
VIGQPRATQRRRPIISDDEDALTAAIIRLATTHGRYGHRRVRALLCAEGWRVNLKRVYRIWRQLVCLPASGGTAESTAETPQTRPSLAERRLLHPSSRS